jgi:hypothetical protein
VEVGSSFHLCNPDNAVRKPTVSLQVKSGTPSVSVDIEGVMRHLILDTGSNVSILQPGISRSDVEVTELKPCGITGETLDIRGRQTVSFGLGGREFTHTFLVCALPTAVAGLLGTDFLEGTGAMVDFECRKMALSDLDATPHTHTEPPDSWEALTLLIE